MSEKTTEVNAQFLFYKKGGGGNIEGASRKYSENTSVKHHSPTQPHSTTHTLTHSKRKVYKQ